MSDKTKIKIDKYKKLDDIKTFTFHGYDLPLTMDYKSWGDIIYNKDNFIIIQKEDSKIKYYITKYDNYNEIDLMINNKIILSIKDDKSNEKDLNSFIRIVRNQEYIIKDGNLMVKKLIRKTSFLKSIKQDMFLTENYLVMDIETKDIDNEKVPYCVSIYDGENNITFYLLEYNSSEHMLEEAIRYLMKRKYDNYKVYLHNFSNFDGIFLLKILSNLSNDIKLIIRDGRLINVRFTYNKEYNLYFRDSYLILPSSLRKLASSFKVENKGIFPYKFVNNEHIKLDYVGKFPRFTFFEYKDILENRVEYIKYKSSINNKPWNFRDETIKYCELDCKILY